MIEEQKRAPTKEEIKFLAGPQSRLQDFRFAWSVLFEFIKGFRALHLYGTLCYHFWIGHGLKTVTRYYEKTEELGRKNCPG